MKNGVSPEGTFFFQRPNQFGVLYYLVKRHFLVFFKNKVSVLFTLMVPLVVLAVYAIFLRPMEVRQLDEAIREGLGLELSQGGEAMGLIRKVRGIADEWMFSGVLSVSCITVSLNTNTVMVHDKETGVDKDFASSPIARTTVMASYSIFNGIVTFLANLLVFYSCLIYLWGYGAILPNFWDAVGIIGITALATISATLSTFFACSFMKNSSTLASFTAIFSAAIGFLCGAYLPANMMPLPVQYVTMFFPGAYASGLFRNYFMRTPLAGLESDLIGAAQRGVLSKSPGEIQSFIQSVESDFSLEMDFFGNKVPVTIMGLVILAFIAIFLVLDIFFTPTSIQRFFKSTKALPRREEKDLPTLPENLLTKDDPSRCKASPDVKGVPASKDNFPFSQGDKTLSSKGHLVDEEDVEGKG